MAAPICSFSVDLDPLHCYYDIHGLGAPPEALRDVILRRGLSRFLALLARRGIKATFFVVGDDLDPGSRSGTAAGRAILKAAHQAGHELASHSETHPYEMVHLPRFRVEAEIDGAHRRLTELCGAPPVGFRSPGYNLSATVIDALVERGYRYDSSVLPAPLYYGAKAAVMGAMRLTGKRSLSVLGDPRFLAAPLGPYRPAAGAPWRRGQAPIVELPITVTPGLRIPAIGTYLMAWPGPLRERLLESVMLRDFFNFELHGIDLIDAAEDGIPPALVAQQQDLRVPLATKQSALERVLDRLASRFRFLRLAEAAEASGV